MMGRRRTAMIAVLVGLLVAVTGSVPFVLLKVRTDDNEQRADDAVVAIRVTCTLLTNAIVQSGAAGRTPRAASSKLNELRLEVLRRSMTSTERARAARLRAELRSRPAVDLPDCDRAARDPGSVVEERQP